MIFIDASRYGNTGQKTGVENYSIRLIDALLTLFPDEITLITPRRLPLDVPQKIIRLPRLWTQVRLSAEVLGDQALRAGTLFIPSHQMPLIHPKKTVITLHDVVWKRFPESYSLPSRLYLEWGAKFAVKRAAKIIVPSQTTKDDLIKWYDASPEKIVVIPHGFTPLTDSGVPLPAGLSPHGYFLFIGRIERKKNLSTLIQAFSRIKTGHKLVLAGKPGVGHKEIVAEAAKNPNVMLTGYVEDAVKAALLKNAFAFVFPSLFEGFGLPLLEAMQFGLPILASDIPATREVAGAAARYFSVGNVEELAEAMEAVIKNTAVPRAAYQKILESHSWETCADQTAEILKNL